MIAISEADRKPSRIDPHGRTGVWNRIPEAIRSQIVDLALDQPELSPRELAMRFTDEAEYFVSEASVHRLLKAHDLINPSVGETRDVANLSWAATIPNLRRADRH